MPSAPAHAAVAPTRTERSRPAAAPNIRLESTREEKLLRLDLSDLVLPKVNDLHVDGLKASWFSRLFGRH